MGLYVNRLDTVTIKGERDLYIYLLDYGWPDGEWESLFKKHFMKMAELTSETNSVVIASPQGIHFANEVLSWHRVGDVDAESLLPAILITHTHPTYFVEEQANLEDLLLIPLEEFCSSETHFIKMIEGIFTDLKDGKYLTEYSVASGDFRQNKTSKKFSRLVESLEIKPGVFGFKLDVKKLLKG